MIWFTADWHLNHQNILKYSNRPFSSIGEMNETLINNYNSVVKENDSIYFLGDFAFRNVSEYAKRLKGTKYFIPGDHDKAMSGSREFHFLEHLYGFYPQGLMDEYGNKRLIVLCHWAMRSWAKSHYGSYHLYAHHHGKLESYGLSFDIGCDTNNYFPYSLDDVEKKMQTLNPIVDFRKHA
jgi:calcineurin-like phosphoesterase family protein